MIVGKYLQNYCVIKICVTLGKVGKGEHLKQINDLKRIKSINTC